MRVPEQDRDFGRLQAWVGLDRIVYWVPRPDYTTTRQRNWETNMRVELTVDTVDCLVGTFEIPPFNEPPAVVIWGDRAFVKKTEFPDRVIYRECFAYTIVEDFAGNAGP